MILSTPVPYWLDKDAAQAVDMCPALALRATRPFTTIGERHVAGAETHAEAGYPAAERGARRYSRCR